MRTLRRSCVRPKCHGGACLPRFSRAEKDVRRGAAWVIAIRRARRQSAADWANMEHFAAAALPAFEALLASGSSVDYVALPQVASTRSFRMARGADTDWFEGLTRALTLALGREAQILGRAELVGGSGCFETVRYATYVPRATYVRSVEAAAALRSAARRVVRLEETDHLEPVVTLLLRSLGGGAARRAGPGWTNARSLVRELEAWLAAEHPGWRLNAVALAHAFGFKAQIEVASKSAVLVGAHGAPLTNALFVPQGAALVEVLNCGHRSNTYRLLATNRGLRYFSATKPGSFRGDDCSRDLGRKNVDARRALALAEIVPAIDAAIRGSPPLILSEPRHVCTDTLGAIGLQHDDYIAKHLDVLSSFLFEVDSDAAAECVMWRAASLVSVHVTTLKDGVAKDPALHAQRRRFLIALYEQRERMGLPRTLVESARSAALEAFATCLIEAQRVARGVIFLHVSKAAGTSFCKVARANGCAAPTHFSTLWAPGDGPTWGNCARGLVAAHESQDKIGGGRRRNCAARELSCAGRIEAFEHGNYDLMAIERWLDLGGKLCFSTFWYVVLVRDPISRVVSHHNHLWRHTLRGSQRKDPKGRTRSFKGGPYFVGLFSNGAQNHTCVPLTEMPYSLGAPHRTGYDWSMVCGFSSNFFTRSLLGTTFSRRPYDATTPPSMPEPDLLRAAKATLASFAVVLVVERADQAAKLVRHALGWRPYGKTDNILPRIGRYSSSDRKIINPAKLHPIDLALLRKHNTLDLELYDYANQLFQADVAFYDHATIFREPVLDSRRFFCDTRNRNHSTLRDPNDEEDKEASPLYDSLPNDDDEAPLGVPSLRRRRLHANSNAPFQELRG